MTKLLTLNAGNKSSIFQQTADFLFSNGYRVVGLDLERPWGFYFYIDTSQTDKFIAQFYKHAKLDGIDASLPLQPKILGIEPEKKLSWQYHHRRVEIWRALVGDFELITSETDEESLPQTIQAGEVISIAQGIRHRGIGINDWALIAEIWQHTDSVNPSNEDDIVRVQDDFGRK